MVHAARLAGLVEPQGTDVRIDHRQVERSKIKVTVRNGDEHGAIDGRVARVYLIGRLPCPAGVGTRNHERSVRQIDLGNPSDESWCSGSGGCDVAVVRTYGHARIIPGEEYFFPWEAEGFISFWGDGWSAAIAGFVYVHVDAARVCSDVRNAGISSTVANDFPVGGIIRRDPIGIWLILDVQGREVLPGQASVIFGTRADVWGQISPMPGLRNAWGKPYGHRMKT